MATPFELVEKEDTTQKKKTFAGWKLSIRTQLPGMQFISARYAKVETEPLLDLESQIEKVGPNGGKVTGRWVKAFYEDGQEIQEAQIRRMQTLEDGTKVEVSDLHRTNTVDVADRQLEECTLVDEEQTSLGCFIPRADVDKYASESTYEMWGESAADTQRLINLVTYLEEHKLALYYPYTFGRGVKIHDTTLYAIREDGRVFLLMVNNAGRRMLRRSLQAQEVEAEVKRPVLVAPRLRPRKSA